MKWNEISKCQHVHYDWVKVILIDFEWTKNQKTMQPTICTVQAHKENTSDNYWWNKKTNDNSVETRTKRGIVRIKIVDRKIFG